MVIIERWIRGELRRRILEISEVGREHQTPKVGREPSTKKVRGEFEIKDNIAIRQVCYDAQEYEEQKVEEGQEERGGR